MSVVVVLLSSCGGGGSGATRVSADLHNDVITVGSFDFSGERRPGGGVQPAGLEAAGFTVHRAFRLGPREFVGSALATGSGRVRTGVRRNCRRVLQPWRTVGPCRELPAHTTSFLEPSTERTWSRSMPLRPKTPTRSSSRGRHCGPPETASRVSATCPRLPRAVFRRAARMSHATTVSGGSRRQYGLKFRPVLTPDAGGPLTRAASREGLLMSR